MTNIAARSRDRQVLLVVAVVFVRTPVAFAQSSCPSGFCPRSQTNPLDGTFPGLFDQTIDGLLDLPFFDPAIGPVLMDPALPGYDVVDVGGPETGKDEVSWHDRVVYWPSRDPCVLAHELYHVYQEKSGGLNYTAIPIEAHDCNRPGMTPTTRWLSGRDFPVVGELVKPLYDYEIEAVQFENRCRVCLNKPFGPGMQFRPCYGDWRLVDPLGLPPGVRACGDCIVAPDEECDPFSPLPDPCMFGSCNPDCTCPGPNRVTGVISLLQTEWHGAFNPGEWIQYPCERPCISEPFCSPNDPYPYAICDPVPQWNASVGGTAITEVYVIGPPPEDGVYGSYIGGDSDSGINFDGRELRYEVREHSWSWYQFGGVNISTWATTCLVDIYINRPGGSPFFYELSASGEQTVGDGDEPIKYVVGFTHVNEALLPLSQSVHVEGMALSDYELEVDGELYSRAGRLTVDGAFGFGYSCLIGCPVVHWHTSKVQNLVVNLVVEPRNLLEPNLTPSPP